MAIHHLSLLMVVVMVVLCLAMNHVPPSMQQDEKPPEPSVKVNTRFLSFLSLLTTPFSQDILTELKSGKRYVFAAGLDNTKMLLFVSGNEASIAFGSGLQVESPGEPVNGSFAHLEKAKNLSKYPSAKFSADELVFAVKDSKGIELVGMSKQGVNVLSLSSGSFDQADIKNNVILNSCFHEGSLHLSSSDAGTYYVLDSKGSLFKVTFSNTDSVALSKSCLEYPLGHLCYQGKKMTLSDTCKDPPPKDIVSGLVTGASAYLFTKTGDLYLFSASLFKQSSGSVDVTVVKAEEAWPTGGAASSSAKPPAPTTGSSNGMLIMGIVVGVALLLSVSGCGVGYYILKQNQPKKSKDAQPSSSIGSFKRQVTAVNQRDHGLDSKQQQDRSRSRSLKGAGARTETGAGKQQPRGESEGGASAPAPAADLPGAPHYHLNVIVRPKQAKDSEKYDVDGPYGNSTLSEALHDGEDPGTEAAAEAALKSKNLPDDTAEMTMEYQSHSHSDVGPPPPPPPPPSTSKAQTPKSAKKKKTKESKRKKSKKGRGGSKKSKQKKKTKSKKKDSLKKTASKQSKQSKQSKKHRGSAKKGSGQKKSSMKKSKVHGSAKKKTGGSSQKKAAAGAASSASRKGGSSAKQQPQQTTMVASKKSAKGQTSSAKGQSSSANKK